MSNHLISEAEDHSTELDTFLESLLTDPIYLSYQQRVVSLEQQIKAQASPEVRKLVTELIDGLDEWRRWHLERYQARSTEHNL